MIFCQKDGNDRIKLGWKNLLIFPTQLCKAVLIYGNYFMKNKKIIYILIFNKNLKLKQKQVIKLNNLHKNK